MIVWAVGNQVMGSGQGLPDLLNELCILLFSLSNHFFLPPSQVITILPLYHYNTSNNLHMSQVSVGNSSFGHYATNYNYYTNESLVSENVQPFAIGRELIDGQTNNINFHPTHAYDSCEGFFEWEGEVKTAKQSCWGCGAVDTYVYKVEPIVDNCGAPLNTASTPELAQVKHMLYEQNNRLLVMEKELKEKKAKVAKLEVNEKDMAGGIIHLIEGHFGPSEKALRGVTTALLPLIFGCWSTVFGCGDSSVPSDGSFGNAFVGGAGSGGSSSSSSVPSLLSDSPVSQRSEWLFVLEEGEGGERTMLSPFL